MHIGNECALHISRGPLTALNLPSIDHSVNTISVSLSLPFLSLSPPEASLQFLTLTACTQCCLILVISFTAWIWSCLAVAWIYQTRYLWPHCRSRKPELTNLDVMAGSYTGYYNRLAWAMFSFVTATSRPIHVFLCEWVYPFTQPTSLLIKLSICSNDRLLNWITCKRFLVSGGRSSDQTRPYLSNIPRQSRLIGTWPMSVFHITLIDSLHIRSGALLN